MTSLEEVFKASDNVVPRNVNPVEGSRARSKLDDARVISNENHVFKKCKSLQSGHDCIVMLEKPSNDFSCNESRTVFNKNIAKFRCNGLLVKIIFDLVLNIKLSCIVHKTVFCYTHHTHYEVGRIVKPNDFDPDLDTICTSGIHYFLTLKAAIGYDFNKGCCIIDGVEYDSNGYAGLSR
jgi:hypothetical protein